MDANTAIEPDTKNTASETANTPAAVVFGGVRMTRAAAVAVMRAAGRDQAYIDGWLARNAPAAPEAVKVIQAKTVTNAQADTPETVTACDGSTPAPETITLVDAPKLTLKRSASRKNDGGWVLFGRTEGVKRKFRGHETDWLEKWFATEEHARAYSTKIGYAVEIDTRAKKPSPVQESVAPEPAKTSPAETMPSAWQAHAAALAAKTVTPAPEQDQAPAQKTVTDGTENAPEQAQEEDEMTEEKIIASMADALDNIAQMPVYDAAARVTPAQVVNAYHEALRIARDAVAFYDRATVKAPDG